MNYQQSLTDPLLPCADAIPFDGHLVLIKEGCEIIVLNETARLIWEALTDGMHVADLAKEMAEWFGLSPERARADVEAALAEWRRRGLFEHERHCHPSVPRQVSISRRLMSRQDPPAEFAFDRTYALCGHLIRFRIQNPDAEKLVYPLLSPSEVRNAHAREVIEMYRRGADHVIAANGAEIGCCRSVEEVLRLALGRVLEVSYPDARWLAMFHAGVVADDQHAILLPGVSGNGKSTLTVALAHAGFHYLSDDVAPLDGGTLQVMPMPFAVSLKRDSWPVVARWFPELEQLPTYGQGAFSRRYLDLLARGGARPPSGMPVWALIFPKYRPDAPTRMRQLRPGQTFAHLVEAGGWVSLDRKDMSSTLDWLRKTPGYQLDYSCVEEGVGRICDIWPKNNTV